MRRVSQRVLVCLLSAGLVCALGGGIALAAGPEDSTALEEEEMCGSCTGEDDCGCCCCTDECEGTNVGDENIQTTALTPEETNKPYHGHSFGELEISAPTQEVSLAIGESVTLTISPYAHVQYVGCSKGAGCGPGLCNGGDESVFRCWEENKGCVCDHRYDTLRLATVTVETDRDGVISCEEICDYSSLETAGDMTDGQVVLTAQTDGTVTVKVNVALYDWEDAEATFTIIAGSGENPEDPGVEEPGPADPGDEEPGEEKPGDADPGVEEPGPADPDDEEPGDENPDDTDPGVVEPGPAEPDDGDSGDENPNEEDPGVVEPGPAEPDEDGSGTDNPNAGSGKTGLLKGNDGKWGYYVDGIVDTSYTGFANNSNGDWYVVNGYVNFDQNSVYKDTTGAIGDKGIWYYVVGNKVQHDFTGLANYKNANGWWYIKDGKVDFTHNGVDNN